MIANRVRHFIAVARAGGFGRAAVELGIAQAPLSQSIQRLERELGVVLFDRHPKGVTLTNAGLAYLPEAEIAVAAAERAQTLARAEAAGFGPVKLGVIAPALWEPLPSMLATAREAGVRVELVVKGTTNELIQGLLEGQLDLSFVSPPFARTSRLTLIDIGRDPLVAAVPASDADANRDDADLARMADKLILFPRDDAPSQYDAIVQLFVDQGLRPRVILESPRLLLTLALVKSGMGSSVVARSFADAVTVSGVLYRPFAQGLAVPWRPMSLAYIQPSGRTPVARLLAAWKANGGGG